MTTYYYNRNVKSVPLVYTCSVLCGIGYGGMLVNIPVILGAYFGRTHYARILGWTAPVRTVFGAGSPLIAGLIFDVTGSYMLAFQVGVVLLGVGFILALLARPRNLPSAYHNDLLVLHSS